MPPSSPISHEPDTEWPTPVRKKVRTYRYGCSMTYKAIASTTGVPRSTVQDICDAPSSRRSANNPKIEDKGGKKSLISPKDTREMEKILEEDGFNARALTWEQLGYEVGLDVSGRTIQRHMGTMEYHKCLACRKGWCNERIKAKRVEVCKIWKERYPEKEDWYHVRFSNECHYGFGPQGTLRILRKPGERYCQDCIQEGDPKGEGSKKGEQKRQHTWASAGHDFKSNLVYYNVPTNTNGKMTHQVYVDSILEPVVKPWLQNVKRGLIDPFVLEEDGDSGHGGGSKRNPVRIWKEENELKTYFNCPSSPDLSPIENCWQAPKQALRKIPHWDDDRMRTIINDGWSKVSIKFINEKVDTMPDRIQAVIDGEGAMTAY